MAAPPDLPSLYTSLLKRALTRYGFEDRHEPPRTHLRPLDKWMARRLARRGLLVVQEASPDQSDRAEGKDWPLHAETMVGLRRLDNLEALVRTVVAEKVPGDLVECGVWRGGASIFMKGLLAAHGDTERTVWLADSFQGLPPPDEAKHPADKGDHLHTVDFLRVSEEQVRANFAKYGLLDGRVRFLKGWFADTLPTAPVGQIALLRADGDMYGSTMDILGNLYAKVSPGGFVVIDDYGAIEACRRAVHDFRDRHGITAPIVPVDWTGVYWRKP